MEPNVFAPGAQSQHNHHGASAKHSGGGGGGGGGSSGSSDGSGRVRSSRRRLCIGFEGMGLCICRPRVADGVFKASRSGQVLP